MKTLRVTILMVLSVAAVAGCKQKATQNEDSEKQQKTTEKEKPELISTWSTDSVLKVPESVCYDVTEDILYVSNIEGKPTEKDGKGFISKVSPEGEVLDLKWVTGIDAPKGMGVYQGKL